ncbi:MAG: mechanosensitive ion channel domain-containing protein [archaeon]
MATEPHESSSELVATAIDRLLADVTAAVPRIVAGLLFLLVAAVVVKAITVLIRWVLGRTLVGDSPVYRQFITAVVTAFLWFAVALAFLGVVGLESVAAALGTASGFLALGVSYALSGMIADAVAGIYLLRDPDFNPGDTVTAGDMTGEIRTIELRKTRIAVDGDTVVRGNAEIEKRWTKQGT